MGVHNHKPVKMAHRRRVFTNKENKNDLNIFSIVDNKIIDA